MFKIIVFDQTFPKSLWWSVPLIFLQGTSGIGANRQGGANWSAFPHIVITAGIIKPFDWIRTQPRLKIILSWTQDQQQYLIRWQIQGTIL